jgi:hypothetical protein
MSKEAVIEVCEAHWPKWKSDCSGFVKAVAGEFGVPLGGNANDITRQIQGEGWQVLENGAQAAAAAEEGAFVIGGREENPHGHVVVVVGGEPAQGRYPHAYWGHLGSVGERNKTVNYSWRSPDRDEVVYAAFVGTGEDETEDPNG